MAYRAIVAAVLLTALVGCDSEERSLLERPPYLGVSCPGAETAVCDRVGFAVWLERPAAEVTATIAGEHLRLSPAAVGRSERYWFGHVEPARVDRWARTREQRAEVTIVVRDQTGVEHRSSRIVQLQRPEERRAAVELDIEPMLPAGSGSYRDPKNRLRVRYPRSWFRARENLTPQLAAPGGILAIANFPVGARPEEACSCAPDLPQTRIGPKDALVVVQEDRTTQRRTEPRRTPLGLRRRVGIEQRRLFYVNAIVGERAPPATLRRTLGVVRSLRFGRREPDRGAGRTIR